MSGAASFRRGHSGVGGGRRLTGRRGHPVQHGGEQHGRVSACGDGERARYILPVGAKDQAGHDGRHQGDSAGEEERAPCQGDDRFVERLAGDRIETVD